MNLHPGLMIGHSLRLDHHLSDGGMASLWSAELLDRGEKVVVKFLAPKLADAPKVADRFRREAEITSMLRDPHVVRVHQFIETRLTGRAPLEGSSFASVCAALGSSAELGAPHCDRRPFPKSWDLHGREEIAIPLVTRKADIERSYVTLFHAGFRQSAMRKRRTSKRLSSCRPRAPWRSSPLR